MTKGKGEGASEGTAVRGRRWVRRSVGTRGAEGGQGACIQKALPASPTLPFSNLGEHQIHRGGSGTMLPAPPPTIPDPHSFGLVWRTEIDIFSKLPGDAGLGTSF